MLRGFVQFNFRSPLSTKTKQIPDKKINKQAHPKFGTILASSSYDGKVLIWREQAPSTASASAASTWAKVFDFSLHTASVNGISWAPHESGCLLACASSDGNVSVLEFSDNSWTHQLFHAHGMGVNSVSWAPAAAPGSIISAAPSAGQLRRFVTGGSDNLVKIWEYKCVFLFIYLSRLNLPDYID